MPRSKRLVRALVVAAALALLLALFTVRQVLYYSADPVAEKDCAPITPAQEDPAKPTRIDLGTVTTVPFAQKGGTINDASCLNRTPVYGVVEVTSVETLREALSFARRNGLKVSVAGAKHSMGGHAFAANALVLDMRTFNRIVLDKGKQIVTVQSGATWHDVQNALHPAFALKAMQSTDIFTVGGSISVNAHGMDHRTGSVGRTVTAMRVMLADGSIHTISRSEEPDLFGLIVGGYGLFGVIIDADIEVTENRIYQSERRILDYRSFPSTFNEILSDDRYALLYGHLSTAPQSFLREMILYTYKEAEVPGATIPPLGEMTSVRLRRLVFNLSKHGPLAMRLKWWMEKYVEPRLENCPVSRNQALGEGEACLVPRNEPMHDSVKYLKNDLKDETDILHEYFVPRDQFVPFVDGLRRISLANDAVLLNASVRIVHREDNFLTYAPTDMYAIVLYLNQRTDSKGAMKMETLTRQLVDLTVMLGGRFFLPYQLQYTPEQLQQSYPEIGAFFSAKKRYDPDGLFTNTFYRKYAL